MKNRFLVQTSPFVVHEEIQKRGRASPCTLLF